MGLISGIDGLPLLHLVHPRKQTDSDRSPTSHDVRSPADSRHGDSTCSGPWVESIDTGPDNQRR